MYYRVERAADGRTEFCTGKAKARQAALRLAGIFEGSRVSDVHLHWQCGVTMTSIKKSEMPETNHIEFPDGCSNRMGSNVWGL